jgi:hypothetical protein
MCGVFGISARVRVGSGSWIPDASSWWFPCFEAEEGETGAACCAISQTRVEGEERVTIDWEHRSMLLGWKRLAEQGHEEAALVVQQHSELFAAPGQALADMAVNPKLRGTIAPQAPKAPPTVLQRVSALGPGMGTMATRFARTGSKTVGRPLDQAYGMDAGGLYGDVQDASL